MGHLVHRLTFRNLLTLILALRVFSDNLKTEKHLLYKSPLDLFLQLYRGLSVIKMFNGKIVGHVTLWDLHDGWYELGTLWVDPAMRIHGVGEEIMQVLLTERSDLPILMTTTNEIVKNMGLKLGMTQKSFWSLSGEVHQATCVCDASKMGSSDFRSCANKDGTCSLFVNRA